MCGAQIVLTLLVLLHVMGWIAVASGLAVIVLAMPMASLVTFCFSKARVRLLKYTDARVKLIAEVCQCSCLKAVCL